MYKAIILTLTAIVLTVSCKLLAPNSYLLKSNVNDAKNYLHLIKKESIKSDLSILASDEFEGRETSYPGQKKAAIFLRNKMITSGVLFHPSQNNYFQSYDLVKNDFSNVSLILNSDSMEFIKQFYSFGNPIDSYYNNVNTVNAGYGIINEDYDSYKNLDVSGKVVVLKEGIPNKNEFQITESNWRKKVQNAKDKGAISVIFAKENYKNTDYNIKEHLREPRLKMHNSKSLRKHLPVFFVDNQLLLSNQNLVSFQTNISEKRTAENVIGFIPGLTKEVIVISAHYDHIGYDQGQICNGADDDGSGTAALLSIANAFQKAYNDGLKPQRGIVFLMVSGEEKGLFGSKFYTDHPIVPLESTVANLNIDMVGRMDSIHKHNNYIYLIGTDKISKQLHVINEQINDNFIFFDLDYTYNDESDPNRFYYRSDHYNFAKNKIPVIFYFGGLHEDYHKPTDDVEKIDFNKLEKISRFVYLTAWELAYRKKTIH